MSNIGISLDKSGTLPELTELLKSVLTSQPKAITLLISSGNKFTKETLDPVLTDLDIAVSGAIFPKLIFKDELLEIGSIIIAWYEDISITNYKNIENIDSIKHLIGNTKNTGIDTKNNGEYLIFIDGAVSTLEENLDALYAQNGFLASFAGGGAGSLDGAIPCIISNEGLLKNTMQTVATNHQYQTTVTHGWKKKSGPHLVTSVKRTKLKTLNYHPVIQFYTTHNNNYGSDQSKGDTNFSSYFTKYPIGIENLDGELLVRDPITYSDDHIEYIGNIPEYSKVHILDGNTDSIRDKVNKELSELDFKNDTDIDTSFIFSCINRDDADENHHSKEIEMLNDHLCSSNNVVGALSLGEIATSKSRLLQLHSKTIVITRLSAEV